MLSTALDLQAVLKANQAISREIVLDKLLDRLLRVVLESAGADRGVVLLRREGRLTMAASITAGAERATLFIDSPVTASSELPSFVVNYVARTRARVVLADASREGMFVDDPYVRSARLRSVLCLPILYGGDLSGILYLENGQVTGAFSLERMELLEMLSSQAAIALENAAWLSRAEEAKTRANFFAETSRILTESLEYQEVLRRLAHLVVRQIAEWCMIDVLEGGTVRRLVGEHADPSKLPVLRDLQERYPCRLDSVHPAARVFRTGEPYLLREASEDDLRGHCEDEGHLALIHQLGTRSVLSVPLVLRGRVLGVLTLCSGTGRRRYGPPDVELAQELADRAVIAIENAQLFQEVQRAVEVRDEFLMIASHELRTPLNSLQLVVQGLHRGERHASSEQRSAALAIAERQVKRLNRLVQELLHVSRIQAGRWPLHLEEVDLAGVVAEVAERFEAELARARCALSVRAPGPIIGRWDRSKLEHVLSNLLANAVKFGAGKPIAIVAEEAAQQTARLVVTDQGIGIPADRLPHIFERFERAVSAREYGGLGLGLYIARSIVESLGGTLRAVSTLGSGSTFTVVLPCSGLASQVSEVGESR
ncbi:MAG: GAF domain-containing protein [Myxococcales bacterium]